MSVLNEKNMKNHFVNNSYDKGFLCFITIPKNLNKKADESFWTFDPKEGGGGVVIWLKN